MRFFKVWSWQAKISALYLLALVMLSLLAPLWTHHAEMHTNIEQSLQGSSWHHWMGTDSLGRDLGLRILAGAQVTLLMGLLISLTTFLLGLVYGAVGAWKGGWVDVLMMRFLELVASLPQMMSIGLIILLFSNLGMSRSGWSGLLQLVLAIALGSWMTMARLVRNLSIKERAMLYSEAAVAIGASPWRIAYYHWRPNILPSLLVLLGLQLPNFLLFESFLSFLGLGLQAPTASWGLLLQEGWRTMSLTPGLLLWPSLVLFWTVLALNLLFEQLRLSLLRPFQPLDLHQ